jgi:hypothetical protein
MENIKKEIDFYLGMESILRYYDEEKKYATLHYFSPTGVEIFHLSYQLKETWQPIGLGKIIQSL